MTAALLCDCDAVLEMEEMGIGVHEILQYACAVLSQREVQELLSDLETHTQVKYAFTADSLENTR